MWFFGVMEAGSKRKLGNFNETPRSFCIQRPRNGQSERAMNKVACNPGFTAEHRSTGMRFHLGAEDAWLGALLKLFLSLYSIRKKRSEASRLGNPWKLGHTPPRCGKVLGCNHPLGVSHTGPSVREIVQRLQQCACAWVYPRVLLSGKVDQSLSLTEPAGNATKDFPVYRRQACQICQPKRTCCLI